MKDTEIQKFYKVHEELLKMREETEENRKISRRETKARKAEEAIEKKDDDFEDEFDEDDDDDEEEEIETDSDDGRDHDPGNTRFIKLKKFLNHSLLNLNCKLVYFLYRLVSNSTFPSNSQDERGQ